MKKNEKRVEEKKGKKKREKRIAGWLLGMLFWFSLLLVGLNVYFSSVQIVSIIQGLASSELVRISRYFGGLIPADEIGKQQAAWQDELERYLAIGDDWQTSLIIAVFVILPDGQGGLKYGPAIPVSRGATDTELFDSLTAIMDDDVMAMIRNGAPGESILIDLQKKRLTESSCNLACRVVGDEKGEVKGYLCVANANALGQTMQTMLLFVFSFVVFFSEVLFVALFYFLVYKLMKRRIIKPLTALGVSAKQFVKQSRDELDPGKWCFEKPKFRVRDEIASLGDSVSSMAEDMSDYMQTILAETREKGRLEAELDLAARIQMSQLITEFPAFPERVDFDIRASMDPAKEVGGDFYDFFLVDEDHLALVIADVSGKGIPASMYMMITKLLLHNAVLAGCSPRETLEQVNEQICRNNSEEMFITVWLGILELSTGRITAANAGHEYPLLRGAEGDFALFKDRHGFVLGGMPGVKYREYTFELEKGGTLFLYTDGAPEATDRSKQMFGTDRMLKALNASPGEAPLQLLNNMHGAINAFVGDMEQFDDLTMIAVRLAPISPHPDDNADDIGQGRRETVAKEL